jgi:PAS domain S-box-containing protein
MPTGSINSKKTPLRVLLIEDYEEDAVLLQRHLTRAGYVVDARRVETAAQLREALAETVPWELVIADYTLPSFGARDALKIIQENGRELPFIIVSGTIDEVSAVNAMRAGAHDYVLKGHLERLLPAIERELADAGRRTERLRTESELRLAQQRFSATFNQAAVGMAHTTTDARFVLVNQRLAEMLGDSVEQILGLSLEDFILPSERSRYLSQLEESISGTRPSFGIELNLLRTNGSTFHAQLTVSLLNHDGQAPTVLWVVEDISARKAAERETAELMTRLINSERLAAAGRMANTLAHEINNPLEALTNIFYLLQTHEGLPAQSQELMSVAAREIERVGHITRSTLSFYRKLPGRTIDLRTMLEEVVQLFQSRATQHRVEIHTRYGDGIEEIRYDPALRQVFANLVGNALEAMERGGGRIVVRARRVDGFAEVLVSDTGHGIEKEHLQAIFEPFFTTKGERGTGLGLWVTRGIVEEQGGTLRLRSCTAGKRHGTTIRVKLPAIPASAVADEATVFVN